MSGDELQAGGFEERLLGELRALVSQRRSDVEHRSSGRHGGARVRRRTRFALASALAVSAILVGLTGLLRHYSDGAPAAYAVTRNSDGSVTVVVRSLRDAAGLQRALRAAGVPAVVVYTPPGTTCRPGWFTPARGHVAVSTGASARMTSQSARFTIERGIPSGDTLIVSTSGRWRSGGATIAALEVALARGPVGNCRPVPAGGSIPNAGAAS
jgi:hypothetical protein